MVINVPLSEAQAPQHETRGIGAWLSKIKQKTR